MTPVIVHSRQLTEGGHVDHTEEDDRGVQQRLAHLPPFKMRKKQRFEWTGGGRDPERRGGGGVVFLGCQCVVDMKEGLFHVMFMRGELRRIKSRAIITRNRISHVDNVRYTQQGLYGPIGFSSVVVVVSLTLLFFTFLCDSFTTENSPLGRIVKVRQSTNKMTNLPIK